MRRSTLADHSPLRTGLLLLTLALVPLAPAAAQDGQPEAPQIQEEVQAQPTGWLGSWTSGWEGSVSLGLNGASGNAENFNARGGVDGTRETDKNVSRFGLAYTYGQSEGTTSNNYFRTDVRNDWLLENSKWRPFVRGTLESDQFQDWRWRAGGFVGAGYAFVDEEDLKFIGRVGVGGRYDFTGESQGFTPEGNLGLDYEQQLNERQSIRAGVDVYPSFDEFSQYRLEGRAEWALLVDPSSNLSLIVGIEDRYDSAPGDGFNRNDINYYALLNWSY
jgi:putative salt-induced outer membrane protein YdiY